MSDRDLFMALATAQPIRPADAIVVLCGEDGEKRADMGAELFKHGLAKSLVLSGGLDKPPHLHSANRLHGRVLGAGIAPDRIVLETASRNTYEQAANVVTMCAEQDWRRLLLCVSAYHARRALLTFVRAINAAKLTKMVKVSVAPDPDPDWFGSPPGTRVKRIDLLATEFAKIERYAEHVATPSEGLAYLRHWKAA